MSSGQEYARTRLTKRYADSNTQMGALLTGMRTVPVPFCLNVSNWTGTLNHVMGCVGESCTPERTCYDKKLGEPKPALSLLESNNSTALIPPRGPQAAPKSLRAQLLSTKNQGGPLPGPRPTCFLLG